MPPYDQIDFEREYCRKHGIDYVPLRRGITYADGPKARQKPSYALRPLEPSDSFAASAVIGTVDVDIAEAATTGLLALHRGPDGFVPMYSKKDGVFKGIGSFPVGELRQWITGMVDLLAENAFAPVNTMYKPARWDSKLVPGAKGARRGKDQVRWLNACLVDLDVGREGAEGAKGLTIGQAIGALIDAQDSGMVPPISIYARSGRGLYALWCLQAEDGNAQPGLPWAVRTAERVNRELVRRLEALAADRRATDAARIIRIPGTRHSISGKQAQYWVAAGPDGKGITYTLGELSEVLQLPPPTASSATLAKAGNQCTDPVKVAEGRKGYRLLWQRRYDEALAVADAIGGIPQGDRRVCITLLGVFAWRMGMVPRQVGEAMRAIAKRCRPPYPGRDDTDTEDLIELVLSGRHGIPHKVTNNYLGTRFHVTYDIARRLRLEKIIPSEIADKLRAEDKQARHRDQSDREEAALAIVRRWLDTRAQYPTGSQLAAELTTAGFPVKQRTAYNLLNAIRANSPDLPPTAERRGRPRKQ